VQGVSHCVLIVSFMYLCYVHSGLRIKYCCFRLWKGVEPLKKEQWGSRQQHVSLRGKNIVAEARSKGMPNLLGFTANFWHFLFLFFED